jgi:hypothetical protein
MQTENTSLMKFQFISVNLLSVLEGLALATFCGLVYYAAFFLQTMISPWVNYTQGIDWLFIPAGIKLVAFMIAGVWGFLGIAFFGLITVWRCPLKRLTSLTYKDHTEMHLGFYLKRKRQSRRNC